MSRIYVVCEHAFEQEDSERPGYSQREVDKYAHTPGAAPRDQHRLSLRRNLRTRAWEYYVRYHVSGLERVVFSGPLPAVLEWGNAAWRAVWGVGVSDREVVDVPCDHSSQRAWTCGRVVRREIETVQ